VSFLIVLREDIGFCCNTTRHLELREWEFWDRDPDASVLLSCSKFLLLFHS